MQSNYIHFPHQFTLFFKKRTFAQEVLPFALLLLPTLLFSQEKIVDKANTAYKYKQYAQAAKLYEMVIADKKENSNKTGLLTLKTKLAYCYRMNNKMDKAETIYAEVVKNERAKNDTYLYYGEALMSNGKYEEAKKWFLDYQKLNPEDGQGALLADNCDKVQLIEPYFPNAVITTFEHNSDADDNAPVAWQNGVVFSSDRKQGVKLMKEKSGWTGRDYLDLYFSVLQEDTTYGEPRRLSAKLSEVNKNTGNASFSNKTKEIYFTRNDNTLNKKETYSLQLFRSEDNGNGKWKKAKKLSFCSPNNSYMHPAISPDGSELFFATDRKGEGGTDLWVSKRKGDDWGKPENLGSTINTSANEGFPFIDENNRLYFCSKGHPTYGGFDIFFSERDENGQWKTPQNLGQPINSPLDDISFYINFDGKSGMLSSSREGGDDDIYFFTTSSLDEPVASLPIAIETPAFVNKSPVDKENIPQAEETLFKEKTITESSITPKQIVEVTNPIETESTTVIEAAPQNNEQPLVKYQPQENHALRKVEKELEKEIPALPGDNVTEIIETETIAQPSSSWRRVENAKLKENKLAIEKTTIEHTPSEVAVETKEKLDKGGNSLFSFQQLMEKAKDNELSNGQVFKMDGATFDANVWQLTPRIAKKLNDLVAILRRYPDMQIELNTHTESLGLNEHNLELSQNRANMAVEYILREGIDKERIKGIGFGETNPLNHCKDGVTCTTEEHSVNQRIEVKIKL